MAEDLKRELETEAKENKIKEDEIWNAAIEAAAKVARDNRADVPCTNGIRKLKK